MSSRSTKPSKTISELAGTSRSTVRQCTSSTGSLRRKPAKRNSSRSSGSGRTPESIVAGSAPIGTATSMLRPLPWRSSQRKCSAPPLWIRQGGIVHFDDLLRRAGLDALGKVRPQLRQLGEQAHLVKKAFRRFHLQQL